jgi:beta-glucosidase
VAPTDHQEARLFPDDFVWGVSTSATQIEGAAREEGRGESIWDRFAKRPGRILDRSTPEVSVDHYHRMEADVALMRELGIPAYRFSVAWPRVLPEGEGRANEPGLAFYDRLVDTLIDAGIQPWACLYHWDLPQALQDRGGWTSRGVVGAFARYSRVVAERLVDRVGHWLVMNEAETFTVEGHFAGRHAPGRRGRASTFLRALHHANLAQAAGVRQLREVGARRIGSAFTIAPVHPASGDRKDTDAAERTDQIIHRAFLDPVMKGSYPELLGARELKAAGVERGDMEAVHEPLDFIGMNTYIRAVVRRDLKIPLVKASQVDVQGADHTGIGWEIHPPAMYEGLTRLARDYGAPLVVTENGAAFPDVVGEDGRVRDEARTRYLADHIAQVQRAIQDGADVRGYFLWSLLDNFEWAHGYSQRFGIVHVDFKTQARTVKDSGRFYAGVIEENGLAATEPA